MDLLYSRYSDPKDLMHTYIELGRLDTLVSGLLDLEQERIRKENEKEEDRKWWELYLHSFPTQSFNDWKAELQGGSDSGLGMTDKQVDDTKAKARSILHKMNMKAG